MLQVILKTLKFAYAILESQLNDLSEAGKLEKPVILSFNFRFLSCVGPKISLRIKQNVDPTADFIR